MVSERWIWITDSLPSIQVSAANGQLMCCIGTFEVSISLQGRVARDTVYVFTESRGMLLAWYTAKTLGILPAHYPQPDTKQPPVIQEVMTSPPRPPTTPSSHSPRDNLQQGKLHQQLMKDYSDVFASNSDESLQPMVGPPMVIHVAEDATPFAVRTARQVPFAWREDVKAQLDQMVAQGIIAPLGEEPADWCHPLVLVAKKSGVRICIDSDSQSPLTYDSEKP